MPLRATNIVARPEIQRHIYFFKLNDLKGTAKASAVDLFRLNTLKGTETAFSTNKKYHEHSSILYKNLYRVFMSCMLTLTSTK